MKPKLLLLKIIYLLSSKNPRVFVKGNNENIRVLYEYFRELRKNSEKKGGISILEVKEFILLTKIFALSFKRNRDLNMLFVIVGECCVERIPESIYFLTNFLHNEVQSLPLEMKNRILKKSFTLLLNDPQITLNSTRCIFVDLIKPITYSLTTE